MIRKTNKITFKVIMIMYGLTRAGAIKRLNIVRQGLQMGHSQTLNVFQYCKAENITMDEFDTMMKRAQEKL